MELVREERFVKVKTWWKYGVSKIQKKIYEAKIRNKTVHFLQGRCFGRS